MLPDNKDPSESDSPIPGDDSATEPVESTPETTSDEVEGKAQPADGEAAAANAQASDDPLDFGDQRMGDADANGEPDSELSQLQSELVAAQLKAEDHWDRLVRLQAEMENQRKRAQNDLNKARKFALESIVGDLLPVKDSLEMGLSAAQAEDADPQSIIEGADLTLKMLAQVFEKNNIIEINPVDEKFDPEFHQAMSMQEIEGKDANTVASVMQKGYTLNERLVRPALVMVAK